MYKSGIMQKLLFTGLAALLISCIMLPQNSSAASNRKDLYDVANQYVGYSRIWSDKDTAVANESDTIKIMGEYWMVGPSCPDPAAPCYQAPSSSAYRISVSGSGNSISPAEIRSGDVVFSVTSTTAETKTITMQNGGAYGSWGDGASIQVSFTAPPSAPVATTNSTSRASSGSSSATATAAKPSAPVISTINSVQLPDDKNFIKTIHFGDPIVLSGATTPNSTVKLTFYSDPITAEVKSDANGAWTYTLAQALPVGDHRVEAQVTDSTGAVSDNAEIARFNVKPAVVPVQAESIKSPKYIFTPLVYALFGLAIILVAGLVYLIIRRRRKSVIVNHQLS